MKRLAGAIGVVAALATVDASTSGQPKNPVVVIATSLGDITVELDAGKAPRHQGVHGPFG